MVELDSSIPFAAARARNAGFERIQSLAPDAELVTFVDGDCEVNPQWLPTAKQFLEKEPRLCGDVRAATRTIREESFHNYSCDVQWKTPVGDAKTCCGDAMMHARALSAVMGLTPTLLAGEEPELWFRLRAEVWKIRRLDHEMTLHDAVMVRFAQW